MNTVIPSSEENNSKYINQNGIPHTISAARQVEYTTKKVCDILPREQMLKNNRIRKRIKAPALDNVTYLPDDLTEAEREKLDKRNKKVQIPHVELYIDSLLFKGELALKTGDKKGAEAYFSEALELDVNPKSGNMLCSIGKRYYINGFPRIAVLCVEEAQLRNPQNIQAQELIILLSNMGYRGNWSALKN